MRCARRRGDEASRGRAGNDPHRQAHPLRPQSDHPLGRHKARLFASALGIRKQDWRYLHDQILAALPDARLRSTRITPFGVTYDVIVDVDGLNGATLPVVTTWIIEGDAAPRLTSTWVDIP